MQAHRALALAAAVSAVLAVGCGDDQEFIDDYNAATKPLTSLESGLGGALGGNPSAGEATRQLDKLASTTKRVNDDLAELEAPEDAKKDFDALRSALDESEQHLRDLSRAAKAGNQGKVQTAAQALVADEGKITKAEDAIKAKVED